MKFKFDYQLPEIAANGETLRVAEHGKIDLIEDDESATLDFCVTDTSRLLRRLIPVEGRIYHRYNTTLETLWGAREL